MKNLRDRVGTIYSRVNDSCGGYPGVLVRTFQRFGDARAPQAAASMAYYAIFSLFPLLLLLIATGSAVLESHAVQQQLMKLASMALPIGQELIGTTIQRTIELRGPVTIVGSITLLWSATGFFSVMAYNINRAWPGTPHRNFLRNRLLALGIVALLAVLLILSLGSTALFTFVPHLGAIAGEVLSPLKTLLWRVLSNLAPWLLKFATLLGLYYWLPATRVKWSAALWGALVATLAWDLVTNAFTWYLSSGLARYELVYGSLAAVVALMFWIYLSSWIILFGAHLSATIAQPSK